ncbi:MAG TPA: alpha/beta fold hydrolase [Gaiellaceae bacterium]|nr:alpha/beta fold hydrolase [Gaiellaceae bacterium]
MLQLSDPFEARYDVPVAGGKLHVALAGTPPDEADAVVLAIHGLTSSLMVWRTVARELSHRTRVCLIAPDLRGRGRSAELAAPFGFDAHLADLLDVLDYFSVQRAVVVGHSMGAYLAGCLAAWHPERVAAVVLADSGLPFRYVPKGDPAEVVERAFGAAIGRLRMTFDSVEEYVAHWRAHPAFASVFQPGFVRAWNDDIDAYARYETTGEPGAIRCVVSESAVFADSEEMLLNESTRTALDSVRVPIVLLRASRGVNGYDLPLIARHQLLRLAAQHPDAYVQDVWGANHYTLVLGPTLGARRVATALARASRLAETPVWA